MIHRRRRLAAAVAAAALALSACGGGGAADGSVGAELPDVAITELGGTETTSLSGIEGPAVINLWATWCPPCRSEIPDFEEVHQDRGETIRFVGISVDADDAPAIEFIDEVGATYDQYHDPTGMVQIELQTTAMPVTVVLDADGKVSTRHLGALSAEALNEAIDTALAAG